MKLFVLPTFPLFFSQPCRVFLCSPSHNLSSWHPFQTACVDHPPGSSEMRSKSIKGTHKAEIFRNMDLPFVKTAKQIWESDKWRNKWREADRARHSRLLRIALSSSRLMCSSRRHFWPCPVFQTHLPGPTVARTTASGRYTTCRSRRTSLPRNSIRRRHWWINLAFSNRAPPSFPKLCPANRSHCSPLWIPHHLNQSCLPLFVSLTHTD